MKICLISPFTISSSEDILSFIEGLSSELIILPGINRNTPSVKEIQSVIKKGTHVFLESRTNGETEKGKVAPMVIAKDNLVEMPKQIFINKPKVHDIKGLIAAWDRRTIEIGTRRFTFIVCGEINGFNPNGELKNRNKPTHDIIVSTVKRLALKIECIVLLLFKPMAVLAVVIHIYISL